MTKPHHKHARLARPSGGAWGRVELALHGAPCAVIRDLAARIIARFAGTWNIGFVDAAHHPAPQPKTGGAAVQYTGQGDRAQLDVAASLNPWSQRIAFNDCDLVLVNGNHYTAHQQVVLVHPGKSPAPRADQLTDVKLLLLAEAGLEIPHSLRDVPQRLATDEAAVFDFFKAYLESRKAPVNGLVLIGGQSTRMGTDKSLLEYQGKSQREHVYDLLQSFCGDTFVSCNARQSADVTVSKIEDRFLDLGPMGGLLSAFQTAPGRAWLTVACDLPHLDAETLRHLLAHRNPAKLATAFRNETDGLPEPLLTIWEPKAYPVLLQALSLGLSCPRKVLIGADVELIDSPQPAALCNVNDPRARQDALAQLTRTSRSA